jgi:poly(3-hydroxybutyrate) depolymerase
MRRLLVIAVLAVGLLGCGAAGGASSLTTVNGKKVLESGYSNVNGTPVLLLRPPQKTNRLVLYVHGSGAQADFLEEEQLGPTVEELLRNGFAVAASNGGGAGDLGEFNWGSPRSVEDSVKLAEATGYKHIYILAQSMGGIGGIELIDKLHPVAWAGIFPVCNLASIWNHEEAPEIEAVWGPGEPPKSVSPATAKDVKNLPVLMFASPEDTTVPIEQNARTCQRWMNKRGAHAKLVETVGEHGDPSNFQPSRLTQFFLRAKQNR